MFRADALLDGPNGIAPGEEDGVPTTDAVIDAFFGPSMAPDTETRGVRPVEDA